MDHVAIMNKSWGLIPKILSNQKKIESRRGINKCTPWGKVKVGDSVYFKNAGESVVAFSQVSKVLEFENLNKEKIEQILLNYGKEICISNLEATLSWAKKKRYCTLIYLKEPKAVRPFTIDKRRFGMAAAWLIVKDINAIKIKS